MVREQFIKELIDILDESMNLIRQDLVSLRNEVMQHRSDILKLTHTVENLRENRAVQNKLLAVIIGGIIAGASSLLVAFVQFFKR